MADLSEQFRFRLGYAVDPAILQHLSREDLVAIQVRHIDTQIKDLQAQIENLQFVKTAVQKSAK